jgi:hypothetical protein
VQQRVSTQPVRSHPGPHPDHPVQLRRTGRQRRVSPLERDSWPAIPLPPSRQVSVNDPEFITIPELARRLGRSKESTYQACRRHELIGCFKIGRRWHCNWTAFVAATAASVGALVSGG